MSDKRTQLEKVAADAVQRTGLHNLSFRTLAGEIGVKSSSVHYYFPEKSDLAQALIKNYTKDFEHNLELIGKRKVNTLKKLEAFIKIFEDAMKDGKLCLCGMMAAEVASLDDKSRELLTRYFYILENWLTNVLEENPESLLVSVEPTQLAKVILSGLEGAILMDRVELGNQRLRAQKIIIKNLVKQ